MQGQKQAGQGNVKGVGKQGAGPKQAASGARGGKKEQANVAAPELPWWQRHALTLLIISFTILLASLAVLAIGFAAAAAPALAAPGLNLDSSANVALLSQPTYADGELPGPQPVPQQWKPHWPLWPTPGQVLGTLLAFFTWRFIYKPAIKTRVVLYFSKEFSHVAVFMAITPIFYYVPWLGRRYAGCRNKDHEGDPGKGGAGASPRECRGKSPLARAVSSANTLRKHFPNVVICMLTHSQHWQKVMTSASDTSTLLQSTANPSSTASLTASLDNTTNAPLTYEAYEGLGGKLLSESLMLPVPYRGAWSPGQDDSECLEPEPANSSRKTPLVALISSNARALALTKQYGLPIIVASPDSGATAHVTQHADALTDCRPCDEVFGQANGHVTRCTAIGNLPVISRTEQGPMVKFTITNVRCVPLFLIYTLVC